MHCMKSKPRMGFLVRSLKLPHGLNSAAKDIFACRHEFGFPSLKFARMEGYVQLGREGIFKLVV